MINRIRSILNLCKKELLAILKDPQSRAILFVPVLVQSMLFGYAATFELNNAPYALYDESHSQSARELIAHLDSNGTFHRVAVIENQKEMTQIINEQKALLIVKISADFERKLSSGQTADIQLLLDARNANTAAYAMGYVNAIVGQFNASLQHASGLGGANPITIESRAWYNPNLETRWFIMPAFIAALSMIQTLLLTALSVAREREQGTFDQLLVTPLNPMEIMLGKAIVPVCIGLVQSTIILLIILFWFQIPMAGSFVALYFGLLLFTIASVGIGLTVSAVSANMQQAMFYTFMMIMPMILLSGLTTPVHNMPKFLQYATMANPLRFAVDYVRRVYLEGATIGMLTYDLLPLVLIALCTLPTAAWFFKNKLT